MRTKKLISLVIPVYNEEDNVERCYTTLTSLLEHQASRYDYEFIFTDNHSTDQTFKILERLASHDLRVRALRFSKNFGYQRSIYIGYMHVQGDAAIQIDCDLEDPPEKILEFLEKWEAGYQVVYGIRQRRKESWWLTFVRKCFYYMIDLLSDDSLPRDAGDFRLVDRIIIHELRKCEDYQPYLRGTIASMGFNQIGIPVDRQRRFYGQSKFNWKELFSLAFDGILNHTLLPLRLATYTGLVLSILTFFGLIGYFIGNFVFGKEWPAGFTTLVMLLLLSISMNALFLGIIGEYLGRMYRHIKKQPSVIIERQLNLPEKKNE